MIGVLAASFAAFGFGVLFQLRGKKLLAAAVGGGVGWFVYLLSEPTGSVMRFFLAAVAFTLYSEIMARAQRAPVIVYLVPALLPTVPGGMIYQSMLLALRGDSEAFMQVGLEAMSTTGALAIGIVATSSIARLLFRVKFSFAEKKA